jgi:hypothetical protein
MMISVLHMKPCHHLYQILRHDSTIIEHQIKACKMRKCAQYLQQPWNRNDLILPPVLHAKPCRHFEKTKRCDDSTEDQTSNQSIRPQKKCNTWSSPETRIADIESPLRTLHAKLCQHRMQSTQDDYSTIIPYEIKKIHPAQKKLESIAHAHNT